MRTWLPTVALAIIFWPATLVFIILLVLAESEDDKINRVNKGE